MSRVTKTAWDVLSGVVNRCGMFCPRCQKMAWDVLSRDVLSYILLVLLVRSPLEHLFYFIFCIYTNNDRPQVH